MIKWIKSKIEKHPKLWEIFKFLLIGGTATLIDFFIMGVVLYWFKPSLYGHSFMKVFVGGLEPSVLATIVGTGVGFMIGLIFNYIFSIVFVFTGSGNTSQKAKTAKGFLLFTILSAIGLCIHILGMYIGYDLFNINEWAVKAVLTIVILIFNYITRKKFVFSKMQAEENLNEVAH